MQPKMRKKITVKQLLQTAMQPLGQTLYIYGGGWNYEDTGAGISAKTIGAWPEWEKFFRQQNADYCYKGKLYKQKYAHLGLDCSGYIGWLIYNMMNTESGKEGYVVEASKGARLFAEKFGLGTWRHKITDRLKPGDIISIPGHIWLYVGACEDESIVILHSSVIKSRTGADGGGVQLGVLNPQRDNEEQCMAYELVHAYMRRYYPEWNSRYKVTVKSWDVYMGISNYDENTGIFRWSPHMLGDPEGYGSMTAREILEDMAADET